MRAGSQPIFADNPISGEDSPHTLRLSRKQLIMVVALDVLSVATYGPAVANGALGGFACFRG